MSEFKLHRLFVGTHVSGANQYGNCGSGCDKHTGIYIQNEPV
jgi:hypothetical protein